MPQVSGLRLLTRVDCHLCEEAARRLSELGLAFQSVDVDQDAGLQQRYGDAVPVLLLGDEELARAPIETARLRQALQARGLLEAGLD